MARFQRVLRLLLLRELRGGVPRLAPGQVRRPGGAEPEVVHRFLEPHLHGLGPDRATLRERRAEHPRPERGLQALPGRVRATMLPERDRRAARGHARRAGHHQPDGHPRFAGLPQVGRAHGRGLLGLLPQRARGGGVHRLLPRPDVRAEAEAVPADGANAQLTELAGSQRPETAGPDATVELHGRRPRGGLGDVLPVAAWARGAGEAARRRGRARRTRGHPRVPGGQRPGPGTGSTGGRHPGLGGQRARRPDLRLGEPLDA